MAQGTAGTGLLDNRWVALALLLGASYAAAAVGVLSQGSDVAEFYASLDRPWFAPPSWLFGPVWSVLYTLIAVSAWLVWRETGWSRPLAVWGVQMALNAAWTPLFFGARRFALALVVIVALLVAIGAVLRVFRPVSTTAFWLFVPYTAWVAFATALNASLWQLNPTYA